MIYNASRASSTCKLYGKNIFGSTVLFFFTLILIPPPVLSQSSAEKESQPAAHDSSNVRHHSPTKAMLFSMCVPGLGQAYNKKYWKIPIVYASMGTTLYFVRFNNKFYKHYKQAYINKTDTVSSTIDEYPKYSSDQLHELESYHRKYRDLNVILTALFYTINIVDAYVDAHLMNFDVSDDLSLQVFPSMNISMATRKPAAGLTLALTF